jgi:hypothetical protein
MIFSLTAATKNGTGSQTSNNVLVLSLFKMGIPVNGKNSVPLEHQRFADMVHHPRE